MDGLGQPGIGLDDVVVDSYAKILWRLRALHGLKKVPGKRIVTVGWPGSWVEDGARAPEYARQCRASATRRRPPM